MSAQNRRNQSAKIRDTAPAEAPPSVANRSPGKSEAPDDEKKLSPQMLSSALDSLQESICGKIGAAINSLRADIKTDIEAVRNELTASVTNIQAALASHDTRLKELEKAADFVGDCTAELRSTVDRLETEMRLLKDKCEDLEGRSRRNNLRLVGVAEGLEKGNPTQFVSQLLKEAMGLDEAPVLDRAHRALRQAPRPGDPPRPFIIRVHYAQTRDEILRKAGQAPISFNGKAIHVYPDFTAAVMKKRNAFMEVKKRLRSIEGARYGLRYPATLRVTLPGRREHTFDDPNAALEFVNRTSP